MQNITYCLIRHLKGSWCASVYCWNGSRAQKHKPVLSQQNVGGFHCFIKNVYKWSVLWTRANPELLWKDPETSQLGAKLYAFSLSSFKHRGGSPSLILQCFIQMLTMGNREERSPVGYDILGLSQLPLEHLGLMTAKRNLIGGIA